MTKSRIRGRALMRLREQHFDAHPLCVECLREGKTTPATQLDHIVALVEAKAAELDAEAAAKEGVAAE